MGRWENRMSNVTLTEWKDIESKIAADLERRWPWLVRSSPHFERLRVEAPVLKAGAELQWSHREQCATVRISVASSACISGGMADIAEAARQIAEVRDAMLFVHGATRDVTVWRDGECPCSHCSGKGESRGRSCERCDGKGKR